MKQYSISEFKAKCTAILRELAKSRVPAQVTSRGQPLVVIYPPDFSPDKFTKVVLGAYPTSVSYPDKKFDLVHSTSSSDWESLG